MSLLIPAVLLISAVLHSSHADVKHVLEGSAQPPQHTHTYDCQHPEDGSAGPAPWQADNSPYRQAYEYFKQCTEKGNCFPPVGPVPCPVGCIAAQSNAVQIKQEGHSINVNSNPFLNGQIPTIPTSSCVGSNCNDGADKTDLSQNPFLNGNIKGGYKPPSPQACGDGGCGAPSSPQPNYNSNPFLNGGKQVNAIIPEPPEASDFSKNPFLNGGFSQTAFSSSGQAIQTESKGFLGVQPSTPFGIKTKPFPVNYPKFETGRNTPASFPTKSGEPCNGLDEACVAPELCVNGVVRANGAGIFDRRVSDDGCESENKVCCRLPAGSTSSTSGSSSSIFASASSSISSASTPALPSRSAVNPFPQILDIKNGKNAPPGSVINFGGGAGISPGSIQIISDNEAVPNPHVSNSGQSGSGIAHAETSQAPVFASTPDYSNDDLSHISFVSTTRGPQYLPPDSSPRPIDVVPELVAPSISTYQPLIPSTPRPVTKPVIPGPSVVSVHSRPPPVTFIPSPPQPFIPVEPISIYTPTPPPEELPLFPSSPKPFIPQPPVDILPFPLPPVVHEPFIPQEPVILPSPPPFLNPEPEITHVQPSTPFISFENRLKPEPPVIPFFPPQPQTPGYNYPTPTPPFGYPSPSSPKPSISINDNFVPIKTKPTFKPYKPSPRPSDGYEYKEPTPSFPLPTKRPIIPLPQPSNEYENTRPIPVFPSPPSVNNEYLPPIVTPKPYSPQPQPSEGYEYKNPTPITPIKVTNNQYLPPFETPQPNRIPDGSNTNEFFVSKPPVKTPIHPNHEGQPDVPIPNVVGFPRPPQPSLPQAGCAAALKCVQEIYCTAEGVISPVPVILTKAQQLARVPTTECTDREAGIVGRCCRDANYVDPWPSANSINGFDDGQYREDPNLGKYYPQDQRPQRSEISVNRIKAPIRSRSSAPLNSEITKNNTSGIRHLNSQPRGPGPLDAAFAEIPWQAMILRDSTRKLLCGGVIVKSNAVLTSAQCLDGLATNDILIKGGEWKLGIDEEPLPFQIVKVSAIIRHPLYKPGVLQNDLALLMLDENLRTAKNVAPISLSNNIQLNQQQCIATGWGKRILQVHLKGAIMKVIDVNILDNKQCGEVIQKQYKDSLPKYFANTICGFSKNDQCDVDYGSALACSNGNGLYTLAGVFSWDTGCKDDAQIGGYIPPDVEWIEDTCSKPLNKLKAIDKKYNSQY